MAARIPTWLFALTSTLLACDDKPAAPVVEPAPQAKAPATEQAPAAQPVPKAAKAKNGLVLAYSQFEGAKPKAAKAELLIPEGDGFRVAAIEDPDSNVFHKAFTLPGEPARLVTLGGTKATVKLWQPTPDGYRSETLWTEAFGGKFDRMRDAELLDADGDGRLDIAVGTHDQGVVALLSQDAGGAFTKTQLDHQKDTFIHEIEVGDLDQDGVPEIYATPSEPNRLEAGVQKGEVVRYVPGKKQGRAVVADLGDRHAKEILVGDIDGDGKDELYVAVEALTSGKGGAVSVVEPVEIRRYDADTPKDKGVVVATLDDRFCRFLTAGDVDGDGKKELVAAAFRSGVWLLRPGADPQAKWSIESVDRASSGFEHAVLLTDLDEDGKDELYVAADDQGELRRYVWVDGKPVREVLLKRSNPRETWTWNIMPLSPALFPQKAP